MQINIFYTVTRNGPQKECALYMLQKAINLCSKRHFNSSNLDFAAFELCWSESILEQLLILQCS